MQGNLQQRNGQGYQFDYGNRRREVTGKEHYRYDGHGRRVLAWSPTQGSILSQYNQSGQLVFQQDQRQGKNIDHVYLAGSLVATREHHYGTGATAVRYQHTDALGSPVAVTNEGGQVLERTQFEPYGAAIGKTIQGVGYTGHVMDAATGLTYMQQRYYDPGIGRFLSVDPVTANSGTGANFNRYWYANNNPYKFLDPDGRFGTNCYGRLCDRYGEKRGGLCERTCVSASDRGKERTVDSHKDLPALPDRQYTPGNGWGRSVGEDWEKVWRTVPSEQGWINSRTDVALNIPIEVIVNDAGKRGALAGLIISSAVNLLAPDNAIQYRHVSAWGMKYQLGYKHVFNVIENGSVVESRDVYVGHGTIWVNQFEWRTTKQDPVIRTDWEFAW